MAEELDEPDLVMLLKSALIVVGEGIEETMAMVKKIKSQFDFMNTDEYNQDTTSNEEDN
jgi:hypothetical protein